MASNIAGTSSVEPAKLDVGGVGLTRRIRRARPEYRRHGAGNRVSRACRGRRSDPSPSPKPRRAAVAPLGGPCIDLTSLGQRALRIERGECSDVAVEPGNRGQRRGHAFDGASPLPADLGLTHVRTKPFRRQTDGKAERFIKTALFEWAYARCDPTSNDRAAEPLRWTHRYNWHRPHGRLNKTPPMCRLGLSRHSRLKHHIHRCFNSLSRRA